MKKLVLLLLFYATAAFGQEDYLSKWGAQNYVNVTFPSNVEGNITFFKTEGRRGEMPSEEFAAYMRGPFRTGLGGTISLALPPGYYQYIAYAPGNKSVNGSFFIRSYSANLDTSFDVILLSPDRGCDIYDAFDGEALVRKGYELLDKKKKDARKVFYVAAMEGNATAMWKYAQMCEEGKGGRKNKNHATYWYQQAAKHGESYAEAKVGRPQGTNMNVRTNSERTTTSDDQSIPQIKDIGDLWQSIKSIILEELGDE